MSITIMLAVNDARGNHTGTVGDIEVEVDGDTALKLERTGPGADPVCFYREHFIHIGTAKFRVRSYGQHVGNLCWDAAEVCPFIAAEVINWVRQMKFKGTPKYSLVEGWSEFFELWERRVDFRQEMFEAREAKR